MMIQLTPQQLAQLTPLADKVIAAWADGEEGALIGQVYLIPGEKNYRQLKVFFLPHDAADAVIKAIREHRDEIKAQN